MAAPLSTIYSENFKEIKPALKAEEARIEANRCLYCYDAPCIEACPTHIEIPRFIKQIASGDLMGSAKTILEANAFGHSCARACPVEVLCEGACVYHDWQEKPIQIARLQRRATDHLVETGFEPFKPGPDNGRRAAIIGAGPAGISCAFYLRRLGFATTLFDKQKTPGGLNTYGIAEYKMAKKVSLDEIRRIFALGVDVKFGKEVGKDIPVEKLLSDFDAVFISIGLGSTRRLAIAGEDLTGVWDAVDFIRHIKDHDLKPLGKSEATIVIGGGNTAIDCATQSKRAGARKVVMAYRRGLEDMSAYDFERDLAKQDGAEFLWNAAPVRIIGKKKVSAIEFQKTAVRRGKLAPIAGGKFKIPCDRVIKAVGQGKRLGLAKELGLNLAPDGRISVDGGTLKTSHPKVFAGGDAINGGKEVVNAAADGKRAAWGIHQTLFPGARPSAGNDYWISTIDGRSIAPPAQRTQERSHA
ncbi:MAG: NAD(P)-dependent oxidoreductase [Elusimicrobiota bacterium]